MAECFFFCNGYLSEQWSGVNEDRSDMDAWCSSRGWCIWVAGEATEASRWGVSVQGWWINGLFLYLAFLASLALFSSRNTNFKLWDLILFYVWRKPINPFLSCFIKINVRRVERIKYLTEIKSYTDQFSGVRGYRFCIIARIPTLECAYVTVNTQEKWEWVKIDETERRVSLMNILLTCTVTHSLTRDK